MKKNLIYIIILLLQLTLISNVHAEMLTNTYKITPTVKCSIDIDSKNNIRVMQGVYFFNRNNIDYAIYAGFSGDTTNTILTLVDLEQCKVVSTNGTKVLGHANGLTYNSKTHEFYVTTTPNTLDNQYYIDRFIITDNNEISFIENSEIKGLAVTAGLAYMEETDNYFIYSSGRLGTMEVITDANNNKSLNLIETLKTGVKVYYDGVEFVNAQDNDISTIYFVNKQDNASGYAKFVNQGIAYYNHNIYSARALNGIKQTDEPEIQREINTAYTYEINGEITGYDKDSAYILIYDSKTGDYRYSLYAPNTVFSGHLEGLSIVNDKLMLGYNVHTASPKHVSFLEYDLKRTITYYLYDETHENTPIKLGESTCIFGEKCTLKSFEELTNNLSVDNELYFIGWSTNKKNIDYIDSQTFTTNIPNNINLYTVMSTTPIAKGDMNSNGKIDLKDIILLIKKYLKTDDTNDEDIIIGDMNNNNKIDLKDIILLIKKYLRIN